jgi:hypothetical protein
VAGYDVREGCFSASGRAVKYYGSQLVGGYGSAEKAALSYDVVLADVLVKVSRPHSRR